MLRAPGACLDTPSSRAVTMVRPSLETESSSAGCHTTSPARCCCHRSCGTCTEGNDMSEMDPNTGANPRIRTTHLYSSVQIGTQNGATTRFQSARYLYQYSSEQVPVEGAPIDSRAGGGIVHRAVTPMAVFNLESLQNHAVCFSELPLCLSRACLGKLMMKVLA